MRFTAALLLSFLALPFGLVGQTETRTAQVIAFPALAARTYGAPAVALNATASSGLPVSYSLVSGYGRLNGTSLEIEGGGDIVVEATQSGNATFAPAAPVRQTLTVNPIAVRITVPTETAVFTGNGISLRTPITTDPSVASEMFADPSLFIYYGDLLTSPVQLGSDRSAAYRYPYFVGRYVVRATIVSPRNRYAGTATGALEITRAPVTIVPGDLAHDYDGQPKPITFSVSPETHRMSPDQSAPMRSVVRVTYNGSTTPPTAPGTYQVVASVDTGSYVGSASATLTIRPIPATVALSGLAHVADGSPKTATVTTQPAGLATTVTYNGASAAPSAPGNYAVVATIAAPNYAGSASGTLTIAGNNPPPVTPPPPTTPPVTPPPTGTAPVAQTITFPAPSSARVGETLPLAATASSGLPVSYAVESGPATVSGSALTPTGVGTVTVVASQSGNSAYLPTQTRLTITVASGAASVVFGNLIQTADGSPRPVTVTTSPAGLATRVTYNGNVTPPSAPGTYDVVATVTDAHYTGSTSATLTLIPLTPTGNVSAVPSIIEPPRSATLAPGESVTLHVRAESTGPVAYQWFHDGAAIPGATSAALTLASLTTASAGIYTVTVTNSGGSITSAPATLLVRVSTRLANVSTRGRAGSSGEPLIAGFVIAGTVPKQILIRGAGPALRPFGVADAIGRPRLQLYRGADVVADNTRWSTAPDVAQLTAAARASGAFEFGAGSDDSALLVTLPPGAYTALVTNADPSSGSALAEVYDVSASSTRLINLSTRATLSGSGDALIAGLVVDGPAPRRILIRAVGPGLAAFGVTDPLADPTLKLHRGDTVLAENRGWNDAPDLRAAAASVGAFALPAGSRDAAVLVPLEPGAHTVVVTSGAGARGIVLLELYEMP